MLDTLDGQRVRVARPLPTKLQAKGIAGVAIYLGLTVKDMGESPFLIDGHQYRIEPESKSDLEKVQYLVFADGELELIEGEQPQSSVHPVATTLSTT